MLSVNNVSLEGAINCLETTYPFLKGTFYATDKLPKLARNPLSKSHMELMGRPKFIISRVFPNKVYGVYDSKNKVLYSFIRV